MFRPPVSTRLMQKSLGFYVSLMITAKYKDLKVECPGKDWRIKKLVHTTYHFCIFRLHHRDLVCL